MQISHRAQVMLYVLMIVLRERSSNDLIPTEYSTECSSLYDDSIQSADTETEKSYGRVDENAKENRNNNKKYEPIYLYICQDKNCVGSVVELG